MEATALWNSHRILSEHGMEAVYFAMLAAATSKRRLRELHDDMLPANCRLMRDDYLMFERAWDELYPKGHEAGPEAALLAGIFRVLHGPFKQSRGRGTLTGYYLIRLMMEREKLEHPAGKIDGEQVIYSCAARLGYGYDHFTTQMNLGDYYTFEVGFHLTADQRAVVVRFNIWETHLNEPLTHALLEKLSAFRVGPLNMSSGNGYLVALGYVLDAAELLPHLETQDGTGSIAGKCLVAQPNFLNEVTGKLRSIGVPVNRISPIRME